MRLFSITVPSEVLSVSMSGAPPCTSMTSETLPTCSVRSKRATCATCSSMPVRTWALSTVERLIARVSNTVMEPERRPSKALTLNPPSRLSPLPAGAGTPSQRREDVR